LINPESQLKFQPYDKEDFTYTVLNRNYIRFLYG